MSQKTDIAALKKLSRSPRTEEDMQEIYRIIDDGDDVSAALVCGALLEEGTEQLLVAHLVSLSSDEASELFRGFGPLASLSARTKFAYAMGLLGKVTKQNTDLLREIRNAVAHSRRPLSFVTPEIAAVCGRLKTREQMVDRDAAVAAEFEKDTKGPKLRYVAMSFLIFQQLRRAASAAPPRDRPSALP